MSDGSIAFGFVMGIALVVLGSIGGCMRYYPEYNVWQKGLEGQAELAQAEQNRKIKIQSALAEYEAAKHLAMAEQERAKGAAAANKIMSESLNGPGAENYLRWFYIHMLDKDRKGQERQTIYIPVDGLLPITEAGRGAAAAARK